MKAKRILNLLAPALALAACFAPPAFAAETAAKRYNVLLIVRDQEQGSLLAAPGYKTPALDSLAARGVVFQHHYIASAMCSASRAAFLTGLPPQRNGVFDQMQNSLLNDLMAKEVGVNDGSFLPEVIRPAGVPALKRP